MWKALARDVSSILAATILVTLVGSALWLVAMLWLLPRSDDSVKWFYTALLGPALMAPALLGAVLCAVFRSRTRRGQPFQSPYWRETVVLPLAVGLGLGLALLPAAIATGHKSDLVAAFLLGLAQALPLALAVWLVVLVQRLSAHPARILRVAALALVALWLGGRIALDARGKRIFAEYKVSAQAEIAAERRRIADERLPVLFGVPIQDNAAERYRRLSQKIGEGVKGPTASPVSAALRASPSEPSSPEVSRALETYRPELVQLREAVRCTRCDWHFAWERGFSAPLPSLYGARLAADLLRHEAYQHAASGDVAGAVERDLELIRMGRDYESSGALIGALIAFAIEGMGVDALLQLAASDGLPVSPDWKMVESKLDLLEPRLASVSVGFRGERLAYVGWESIIATKPLRLGWPDAWSAGDLLVPGRFIVADGLCTMNAALREAERANELADPREANRLTKAAFDRAMRTPNPIVQMGLPSLERVRPSQDSVTARLRLLRAAMQLETTWQREGRYPVTVTQLPIDPFAYPAALHYVSLAGGSGYKLWSVGMNGKDDGGVAKDRADEVFERPPRVSSATAHKVRSVKAGAL